MGRPVIQYCRVCSSAQPPSKDEAFNWYKSNNKTGIELNDGFVEAKSKSGSSLMYSSTCSLSFLQRHMSVTCLAFSISACAVAIRKSNWWLRSAASGTGFKCLN